jgi:hypothetical protein
VSAPSLNDDETVKIGQLSYLVSAIKLAMDSLFPVGPDSTTLDWYILSTGALQITDGTRMATISDITSTR